MAALRAGRSLPSTANHSPGALHAHLLIEREIPGASRLTEDELRGITRTSNDAVSTLERPYTWHHSYVAGDKIYCVHTADSAEVILEHARRGGFPADLVAEVTAVFGTNGPRELPV